MSQPRRRTTLLAAGAAVLVAVAAGAPYQSSALTDRSTGTDVREQLVSSSDAAGAEVPVTRRSVGERVHLARAMASRAAARARVLWLACPTTEEPGCALSYVGNDAGWRTHPLYGGRSCHTGIDLRGNYGAKVRAAAAGVVVKVLHGDPAYGNLTLLQHGPRLRTMYAHQSTISVHVGERVRAGEVIGRVGATGYATGPHLHFEVHLDRRPYDPAGWFGGGLHRVGCYPDLKY